MPNDEQVRDNGQDATVDISASESPNGTEPEGGVSGLSPDSTDASGEDKEPASATGDSVAPSQDELASLRDRVSALEAEVADLTDQLLRKSADFENYRKRVLRERESIVAEANRSLLLDIVEIIDNFERAIRSADESQDFTAFHDGIVMIEKQFTSMLERKWELVRFDSEGEEFDPQRHEAMFTEERADHEHSIVLEDLQKGYLLQDKILRPAKVKVSLPAASSSESDE
jgi:molecular chaperone GrpE